MNSWSQKPFRAQTNTTLTFINPRIFQVSGCEPLVPGRQRQRRNEGHCFNLSCDWPSIEANGQRYDTLWNLSCKTEAQLARCFSAKENKRKQVHFADKVARWWKKWKTTNTAFIESTNEHPDPHLRTIQKRQIEYYSLFSQWKCLLVRLRQRTLKSRLETETHLQ